jgi:putative DNA primase/helicase
MTLTDLLGRFDDVEETADGYLVHCPAHVDSHQSLRLTVSDAGKVLVRCRAGCPTTKVLESLGLTMKDLASMTPGDATPDRTATSVDVPAPAAEVAALAVKLDAYAATLATASVIGEQGDPGVDALDYASRRFGVTAEDARRLGLGYATDLGGGPRLVVPFRDREGVARGFQARALDPASSVRWLGPKSPEGASWAKIGFFPGLGGYDEILITEGPGDALTGAAAGFDTIGIRGAGLATNASALDALVSTADGRPVVIAGDGDVAGRRFAAELADALLGRGLSVKLLPMRPDKDLTDWRADDPERFHDDLLYHVAKAEVARSLTAALLAWDEDRYSLSDLGGARYLRDYIESLGSGVRYSEEAGFFLLDEGVWRKDERQAVRTHAQSVADLLRGLAMQASSEAKRDGASDSDVKRAARLNRYAAHAQTTRGLDAMIRELQAVQGVPASIEEFDQHGHFLAARNGVIDLRTGELRPHDPTLLITKRVDLVYEPDAQAPRWEQFLREIFPAHPTLPAYMQRLVGYGITGQTDEQCFAVLWGTGANGKSVLTDTLTGCFRELTVTTPFATFEDRGSGGIPNDVAALKGARLVMAAEGEQGRPMAESVLKRVTGRDMISARFMRKEFFEFRPTFLLMLATNFKPSFKGQDEGLWRRVKLIPFERYFLPEERDHRLGDALLAEAPGILAWAVRGAIAWYAGGLQDPDVIRSSTKEYRETSDALAGFLPGVFVFDADAGRVEGKILFEQYLQWADEENLPQRERWTRRTFFAALEERGLTKRRTNGGVAFENVRRARLADRHPEEVVTSESDRAADEPLALSPDKPPTAVAPALSGPDLDGFV